MTDSASRESSEEARRLLAADHSELDGLLRDLRAGLEGGDAAVAFARLDLFWARLAMHIRAENLHLFPAILKSLDADAATRERAVPSTAEVRADIARLRGDHDFFMHELASAVKASRELPTGGGHTEGVLRDVSRIVRALDERLAAHNELEEEMVYRLPLVLLSAAEQAELAARVKRELDNLPPRFRRDERPATGAKPAGGATVKRRIVGFELDDEGHWRAELECGHFQHVRHDPPLNFRPWVLTEEGRASRLGLELVCKLCGEEFAAEGAERPA